MDKLKIHCRKFFTRHPDLRRRLDEASRILDFLTGIYIGVAILGIIIISVVTYSCAPEEIKEILSILVGSSLSIVIIPFLLNYYNGMKTRQFERYQANMKVYGELVDIILKLLTAQSYSDNIEDELKDYLENHEKDMLLAFSTRLISDVYLLYEECIDCYPKNIRYYCKKCLLQIRREAGLEKGKIVMEQLDRIREKVNDRQEEKTHDWGFEKEYELYKEMKTENYFGWKKHIIQTYCCCGEEALENLKQKLIELHRKQLRWRDFWMDIVPWMTTIITVIGVIVPIAYSTLESISDLQSKFSSHADMKSVALENLESIMSNFDTIYEFCGYLILISVLCFILTSIMKWRCEERSSFLFDFINVMDSFKRSTDKEGK